MVGPDMGVRMFTTARQMETWAHGQAIYDLMGATRQPTDGCATSPRSASAHTDGLSPTAPAAAGARAQVRLAGPSGKSGNGTIPEDNAVEGNAVEFCQVVTQTRNVADTTLSNRRAGPHLAQPGAVLRRSARGSAATGNPLHRPPGPPAETIAHRQVRPQRTSTRARRPAVPTTGPLRVPATITVCRADAGAPAPALRRPAPWP